MDWVELSVQAEAEAVESVVELLSRLGHGGGVAIEEPLLDSAEPGRVEMDPSKLVTVKSYLLDDEQLPHKIAQAEEGLWHLSQIRRIEPLKVARIAEKDWAEAWKEFFHVQRIGARVVVKPTWRDYQPAEGDVVLEMDPGMAFGTGQHPTTRMCVLACERLVRPGMRVLDVGTGSGILSLAAARLGAESVIAVDTDPVAVESARRNVDMNGLADRIEVRQGSVELVQGESFDLVLANIIAAAIIELARPLADALSPNGRLVASGIIAEREMDVKDAVSAAGLKVEEVMAEGDWRTMVCRLG